jgi:adenine specific DNA methylase Mod
MPTLDWIGKKAVLNHHREVPYRLLQADAALSVGDPESGNLLVEGDNLLALKALLPYYAGKVKCIYIDPPYNTGNENWIYNDAVNSPEIRKWLGKVVGPEAQDLSRHDKWLCMMYPRLSLLREFLTEDGAIFVSIGDDAVGFLRLLMDEVFGPTRFVATVVWQKRYSRENRGAIGDVHEYILVYARDPERFKQARNRVPLDEKSARVYKNPNNDPKGRRRAIPMSA